MSFVSGAFLIFLPVTALICRIAPPRWRYILLLAASYAFYMSWSVPHALLLLGEMLLTWAACLLIERYRKRWLLVILLCASFAPLAVCKYAGFLTDTLNSLAGWPGQASLDAVARIALPVGISFYTFQAVSCVIDVYHGDIPAEKNPLRYALFVSFFPQLVAGPIERASDLMPQLVHPRTPTEEDVRIGLRLLLTGFFRKVCIADSLAPHVDAVYGMSSPNGGAVALATILFAFQIYNDFAGYSEIALGAARLVGVRLTRNFDEPYLAVSLRDFWRRWHITLNRWFTVYVYRPLGGNRRGKARQMVAISAVFLLSGLWHGADWTFVAWGAFHAVCYAVERFARAERTDAPRGVRRIAAVAVTFLLVCLSWVLFRASDMSQAMAFYRTLFSPWNAARTMGEIGLRAAELVRIAIMIGTGWLVGRWAYQPLVTSQRVVYRDTAVAALLVLAIALSWLGALSDGAQNAFIYFQF